MLIALDIDRFSVDLLQIVFPIAVSPEPVAICHLCTVQTYLLLSVLGESVAHTVHTKSTPFFLRGSTVYSRLPHALVTGTPKNKGTIPVPLS